MSFTWWRVYSGVFYIITLIFMVALFMGFFNFEELGFTKELIMALGLTFAILSTILIYSLCLNRAVFILITILSFNPIIWIINFFYIKKRWSFLMIQND